MDAGEFSVLMDVADDAFDAEVGADGEFADAIGVLVGVGVGPEIGLELLVQTGAGDDAVGGDVNGQRGGGEETVACAEPVADDTINNKSPVDFAGRGEAFAAGKIAPLFWGDDA